MFHLSQEKIGIKSFSTWVESSIRDRKYIFFRSLKMVDENLWKGTGVDSFQMHFLHYEQKEMGEKIPKFRKPYGKIRNVSAHNFYLLKCPYTARIYNVYCVIKVFFVQFLVNYIFQNLFYHF